MRHLIASLFLAIPLLGSCSSTPAVPNSLTDEELAAGWQLLFDGESLDHWRTYQQPEAKDGWQVVDGVIARVAAGGDLITREQYGSFVLELEWMISPKGNSGIFFHVTEDRGNAWETGPEMQILDNDAHADGGQPKTSSGTLVLAPRLTF